MGESGGKSNACNAKSKPPDARYYGSAVHTRACTGNKNAHSSVSVQNRTHVHMNFCLESLILSYPKVVQISPESPCIWSREICCATSVVSRSRGIFGIEENMVLKRILNIMISE